jgi:hypothetical protein
VRRRLPLVGKPEPPQDWPWHEEPALVPVGPPRRPLPAAEVALEEPAEPDPLEFPTETDALGRPLSPEDEDGEEELRLSA